MRTLSTQPERRAFPRRKLDGVEQIREVKLGTETVHVVDISRGGLLMTCAVRLCLRNSVRLKIIGAERTLSISCRIVRARVARLSSLGIIYQVAVAFERPLSLLEDESLIEPAIETAISVSV